MLRNLIYIAFGTILVGSYALTVRNGVVYGSPAQKEVMPPDARALGNDGRPRYRHTPLFWATGFHGGK